MSADPHPEFRCRCVHSGVTRTPDPFRHRCWERPTEEDGLCDHCRGGVRPLSDEGWRGIGKCFTCGPTASCCLHSSQTRLVVDLMTPCAPVPRGVLF